MLTKEQIIRIATEYKEKGPLKLSQEMGLNYPTVIDTVSRLIKHGVKVPRRQSVNPDFAEAVKLLKPKYE